MERKERMRGRGGRAPEEKETESAEVLLATGG